MAEQHRPEERVRQRIIKELGALGWPEDRLRWRPEWPVPNTPHDLTKRERNQRYDVCGSADLVAFADTSGAGPLQSREGVPGARPWGELLVDQWLFEDHLLSQELSRAIFAHPRPH